MLPIQRALVWSLALEVSSHAVQPKKVNKKVVKTQNSACPRLLPSLEVFELVSYDGDAATAGAEAEQSFSLINRVWRRVGNGLTINHVSYVFFLLATLHSFWDLRSLTRDRVPALGSESAEPYHWTAKEFPCQLNFLRREWIDMQVHLSNSSWIAWPPYVGCKNQFA